MKQLEKPVHNDLQHEYSFYDIIDRGEEIHKVYDCSCGRRKIEVYWLIGEHEVSGGDKHD